MSKKSLYQNIQDLQSFNKITGENYEIAGLYFYYMLDHLIDLAYAVAQDFSIGRVHLFTKIETDNSLELIRLYTLLGNNEIFLSREHRHRIWHSFFGHSLSGEEVDSYNFPELMYTLLEAANDYVCLAEIETGASSLISSLRLALIPFRQYILAAQEATAKLYRQKIFSVLTENNVYQILRDPGVTAVYGVSTPLKNTWPYTFDLNANKVIQEISHQLRVQDSYGRLYTQKRESYLETAAKWGAVTIATALDTDPDDSSDEAIIDLINKCHAWHTAIKFLGNYPISGKNSINEESTCDTDSTSEMRKRINCTQLISGFTPEGNLPGSNSLYSIPPIQTKMRCSNDS